MPLQAVETLEGPPIVGTRYLVPTVLYTWFGRNEAWPVMGPKHADGEHLAFHHEHYHVDVRFLSDAQVRRIERAAYGESVENIVARYPLATIALGSSEVLDHPAPVRRRLTCRRSENGFPGWAVREQQGLHALATAFAGRRCGRNAEGLPVCPHKGFVLSSLKPDAAGRVTCPLHGLVIDLAAEAVCEAPQPYPR